AFTEKMEALYKQEQQKHMQILLEKDQRLKELEPAKGTPGYDQRVAQVTHEIETKLRKLEEELAHERVALEAWKQNERRTLDLETIKRRSDAEQSTVTRKREVDIALIQQKADINEKYGKKK